MLPQSGEYSWTLGVEWNTDMDHFKLTIAKSTLLINDSLTKRALVSDNAKMYDVFGWFSPSTIEAKILLQQVWEKRIGWDDPVPSSIYNVWFQWRSELHLSEKHIPRCYFDRESRVILTELHGFCDASKLAYAAVVYLRLTTTIDTQISLVIAKTKLSPIKWLTIPRLELCGASLSTTSPSCQESARRPYLSNVCID